MSLSNSVLVLSSTSIWEASHLSSLSDLTLLICEPSERWTCAHASHRNTPKLYEAHSVPEHNSLHLIEMQDGRDIHNTTQYKQHYLLICKVSLTTCNWTEVLIKQEAFEKMLGPFATASCCTPIHQVSLLSHANYSYSAGGVRCLRQQQRQQQCVTEGTAMAQ